MDWFGEMMHALPGGYYNYWVVVALMMTGLYTVVASENFVKKIVGLNIFQAAVFLFFISVGKVEGGTAPILDHDWGMYSNPLTHVLILTAIVVGVATTAVGLALIVRVHRAYGTLEDEEIRRADEASEPPA